MSCADLLQTVKAIETTLKALRTRLVHAIGRKRQDLQLQIADMLDDLAIAERAYDDGGCVTPPPPATFRWLQANPYARRFRQRNSSACSGTLTAVICIGRTC
jgi:hypothetical protein